MKEYCEYLLHARSWAKTQRWLVSNNSIKLGSIIISSLQIRKLVLTVYYVPSYRWTLEWYWILTVRLDQIFCSILFSSLLKYLIISSRNIFWIIIGLDYWILGQIVRKNSILDQETQWFWCRSGPFFFLAPTNATYWNLQVSDAWCSSHGSFYVNGK